MLSVKHLAEPNIRWLISQGLCSIWYDSWLDNVSISRLGSSQFARVRDVISLDNLILHDTKLILGPSITSEI